MHQFITAKRAPAAIGPYSQAVQAGKTLYISGQLPINPIKDELIDKDFSLASHQVLNNIYSILEEAAYEKKDVVKVTVYLKKMKNFKLFNEIYADFFGEHKPARAVVEVSHLPKGAVLEAEAIAVKP